MTYRDDQDATLARAEALETELEREKAKTAKLEAELEELRNPKPKPEKPKPEPLAPSPSPSARSLGRRLLKIASGSLVVGGFFFLTIFMSCIKPCVDDHRRSVHRDEVDERHKRQTRWESMIGLDSCVRSTELADQKIAGLDAATTDPRRDTERAASGVGSVRGLGFSCKNQVDLLVMDETVSQPVRDLLAAWVAREAALEPVTVELENYYAKGDYKEDHYASAVRRWAELRESLALRNQAVAGVRLSVLGAIHELMRGEQADHETRMGRDEVWWRIELGFALNDLIEVGHRARRSNASDAAIADAIREPARKLLDAAKQAPLAVRRDVREITNLEQMAGRANSVEQVDAAPYPAGAMISSQGQSLWAGTRNPSPIAPEPESPEGCGGC